MKVTMHINNWLQHTRLAFDSTVCFTYAWVHESHSHKWCQHELKIVSLLVVNWNNYLWEICVAVVKEVTHGSRKIGRESDDDIKNS